MIRRRRVFSLAPSTRDFVPWQGPRGQQEGAYDCLDRLLARVRRAVVWLESVPRDRAFKSRVRSRHFRQILEPMRMYVGLFRQEIGDDPTIGEALRQAMAPIPRFGIELYPNEQLRYRMLTAELCLATGDAEGAVDAVGRYAERPYLAQNPTLLGFALYLAIQAELRRGNTEKGRHLALWTLWYFRDKGFRRWLHLFFGVGQVLARLIGPEDRESGWRGPVCAILRRSWRIANRTPGRRRRLFNPALPIAAGCLIYAMLRRAHSFTEALAAAGPRHAVLVTRAMGGIGDLLMMTPGFRALAQREGEPVHLAIPKGFFPVFDGNPDVVLHDIEGPPIEIADYRRWVNFTTCPAAGVESASVPSVTMNRIEIFAQAMGVENAAQGAIDMRPRYVLLDRDREVQRRFWQVHGLAGRQVIGVQLYSNDSYKDYRHIHQLVLDLAERWKVVVFDGQPVTDFEHPDVIDAGGLPLRDALAIAASCDVLVGPDSAFLHLAGALDRPSVALFGPTDGRVMARYYPRTVVLDVAERLSCLPCWRNEDMDCGVTRGRASLCMAMLEVSRVVRAVEGLLAATCQASPPRISAADGRDAVATSPPAG